jgi:predicted nucleotidyltransferase component of viral defense system
MITFGELRKKSVEWQMEISAVEKVYALDWLLKGIFEAGGREARFVLREASALALAYSASYPRVSEADLARDPALDLATLERIVQNGVLEAVRASGMHFELHQFQPTEARIEYTGPLGRRSAAQPLLVLRFAPTTPRDAVAVRELVHPFAEDFKAIIQAVSPEELAAGRLVLYAGKPRARDVFDLWFILAGGNLEPDSARMITLARTIAGEKGKTLRGELDPQYAPLLERGWDTALKEVRGRPSFEQARLEIETKLQSGGVLS